MADIDYESRAKKFHEGWVLHQPGNSKGWTKYWMVLRGIMLFIFTSKETTHETMKGTLTITRDTEIRNLPPDSKKKGFKFELETTSSNGDRKVNRLKFDTENEKDLWKSFIFGIANGIVPSDVHLLPGQLKDVHEAIGEVRSTPPPLPSMDRPMTIPRPMIGNTLPPQSSTESEPGFSRFVTGSSVDPNGLPRRRPSTGSASSGDSGGITQVPRGAPPPSYPSSTMPTASYPSSTMPPVDSGGGGGSGGVNNLRELRKRQAELTNSALASGGSMPHETRPSWSNDPVSKNLHPSDNWLFKKPGTDSPPSSNLGGTRVNHNQQEDKTYDREEFVRPPTRRPDYTGPPPASQAPQPPQAPPQQSFNEETFVRPPPHPVTTMPRDVQRSVDPNPAVHMNRQPSISDFENHLFYLDPDRNREYPTWFFNDCSRDEAESVLTVGRQYGNVMMRTSSSFASTGKYVISMRREIAGGTTLYHYEVAKHGGGFKINVDNHHNPMRCLSEVMDFFVSVAGPGTLPMKTNAKDRIFNKSGGGDSRVPGSGLDNPGSSVPPPPSFPSNDGWSSSSSQTSGRNHLNIIGAVDPTITSTVNDMNSQFVRRDSSNRPPSTGGWTGPGEDYQNVPSMHGNSLQYYGMPAREVGQEPPSRPPRLSRQDSYPSNGHGYPGDRHSNHRDYSSRGSGSNSDRSSGLGQSIPPPPMPPPVAEMGRMNLGDSGGGAPNPPPPPPMGGPPPPPPPPPPGNSAPAPPPLPGGHPSQGMVPPPPAPSNQTMRRQDSWHNQNQFSPPTSPGYPRPPSAAGGNDRPGGSRFPTGPSFEDELKSKLKGKKEEIYATATILKNY